MTGEVKTADGWRPLGPGTAPPRVVETESIELRGLPHGGRARIGGAGVTADREGRAMWRPASDEHLRGHVGLVPVEIEGRPAGEIEIVPGKLSEPAYQALKADLESVWGSLVLDPQSPVSVRAAPPSARELWRRIDHVVTDILASPHEHLRVGEGVRRMDRVRHRRELRPAVVRAGRRGRPAATRVLERTTDTPENHLVGTTLRLLHEHARGDPGADDVMRRIGRLRREPTFTTTNRPLRQVTWGMRSDPRYRQVLAVHQILNRPELAAVEGPGELRLGVEALPRLYEYWVFLQVLLVAWRGYGPPEAPGFAAALAVPLPGRRRRLELARGTTVTFPGPVHVAFEPEITTRGDGWMDLEYVPHPDPAREQLGALPDVAIFRPHGTPWLTVIDAKYVGRHWVGAAAARTHEKYARMRRYGTPVVRNVLVAHPHEGLSAQWAGYGYVPMRPGTPVGPLPLPLPPV